MNMESKKEIWQEFFWRSFSPQTTISLEDETNRVRFFLENSDISEKDLKDAIARMSEEEEEIKRKEGYKFSPIKIIFRAPLIIAEEGGKIFLKNLSQIVEDKTAVIYINLQQFIEESGLNIEKMVAIFTLGWGNHFIWQIWKTKEFQEFLRKISEMSAKQDMAKVIKNDLIQFAAFLWLKEECLENEQGLSEIVSEGLKIEKKMIERIFQKLRFTRDKKKQKRISANLREVLVALILFSKEAEIVKDEKLEEEITREINQLIARGSTEFLRREFEELKGIFNQAETEIKRILLPADFDFWLPEAYDLEQRRKKILIRVLEKKSAPDLVSKVAAIEDELEWEKMIGEIKESVKITPAEIEEAEKPLIKNKD